ncbi:MAG: NADH-quinone oxidoreductase subunit J [Candidatus Syntropharchaeia archaeon]
MKYNVLKGLLTLLFLGSVIFLITSTAWGPRTPIETSSLELGKILFRECLVAFEVVSVLLTAALIGAIFLAKEEK